MFSGTYDVGHHRRALEAKDVDHDILHRLGQPADGAHDPVGHRCFQCVFEGIHAPPEFAQALPGINDADRQREEYQAELVAQFFLGAGSAQIHGDDGAKVQAIHPFSARQQVAAQGAAHGCEQDIIDRATQLAADDLDVLQGYGLGPGSPLGYVQRALEDGLAVRPEEEQPGQGGRAPDAQAGQVQRMRRICAHLAALLQHRSRHSTRGLERLPCRVEEPAHGAWAPPSLCLRFDDRPGRARFGIGQRKENVDQGQAIADAMVQAAYQGAALPVSLDKVQLPQGLGGVELGACQQAGGILQRSLVTGGWQGCQLQVVAEVEIGILLPIW